MNYHCINCNRTFTDFPAANNHEKDTEYKHITQPARGFNETLTFAEELVLCGLSDCPKIVHAGDAIWDEGTDNAYCSFEHHAEDNLNNSIGFFRGEY